MDIPEGSDRGGREGPRSGRTGRSYRSSRPPPSDREAIDVQASDGWRLRADVHEPKGEVAGVVVLAHASAARRSEFERPAGAGLVRLFVDRGWRAVTFDFRGHGDSGPRAGEGRPCAYDDFVTLDVPAVHAFARSRAGAGLPVVLAGHSLGGHAGLAAQALGLSAFDRIVGVGASVWLEALDPSAARWLLKRAALRAALAVARRAGRFPARRLRLGSDDESLEYVTDFERFARTGRWGSADGRIDYLAALGRLSVPVLHLVSDGDRLECPPESGARFLERCGGPRRLIWLAASDDGGAPPNHMGLVTDPRVRGTWERIEAWMRGRDGGEGVAAREGRA